MSQLGFDTPKSSMTSRVSYNVADGVLSMHFKTGGTHHFAGVPVSHYQAMQDAETNGGSVGKYYHAHIKDKFKVAK